MAGRLAGISGAGNGAAKAAFLRCGTVALALLAGGSALVATALLTPGAEAQTTPLTAPMANPLEGRAGARCFQIRNHAPYTVYGHAATADDHRANFHLKTGEGVEVCVTGPYYPGGKIEVTTKTLIPTFSCLTVPEGVVTIDGQFVEGGGTKTRVNCH